MMTCAEAHATSGAGVSEGDIMKRWGWRTRSMFDRSNVIDDADLAAAVAKRLGNAKQAANKWQTLRLRRSPRSLQFPAGAVLRFVAQVVEHRSPTTAGP